jgi:predicted RNA methylase
MKTDFRSLRSLYKDFLEFDRKEFIEEAKKDIRRKKIKLSVTTVEEVYDLYWKPTFIEFVSNIRNLAFFGIEDFLRKRNLDLWDAYPYLKFLLNKKLAKIERGKIKIDKELSQFFVKPLSEDEIRKILREKLRNNLDKNIFIKNITDFNYKPRFDQLPISLSSSIFLTSKILEYIPLPQKFLFVGDDDFSSLVLGLVSPDLKIYVVDVDEEVLSTIRSVSERFELNIKVKKLDVRKKPSIEKDFIGFCTNPPYTLGGIEKFIQFGLKALSRDGAFVFLEMGGEDIGKRSSLLQKFFLKNNLIVEEIILGKIDYPFLEVDRECKYIKEKFKKLGFNVEKTISSTASLYIFHFVPWKIKKIEYTKNIYFYL